MVRLIGFLTLKKKKRVEIRWDEKWLEILVISGAFLNEENQGSPVPRIKNT